MTRDWTYGSPVNDEEPIDALLRGWARNRDVAVSPGEARAAADRALKTAQGAGERRWMPAAIFGGSVAAALAGVLLLTPASEDPLTVGSEEALVAEAGAPLDDGLPRMVAAGSELAAVPADFPEFDAPPDDVLMTSHVFTMRPEEELIY